MSSPNPSASLDVTVAILLHGDAPQIGSVLRSIMSQRYALGSVSVLCLDDGTSPIARDTAAALGIPVVDLPHGCSIAAAKNMALRLCRTEYVFFLDDHIVLEGDGLHSAMRVFLDEPCLAGVCGFYRSGERPDWNVVRDVKRHSIYGKGGMARRITLDNFTTFSTGIGIIRKSVFDGIGFPEEAFPIDFGGEDTPALLRALNQGHVFAYVPDLRGVHEHGVTFWQLIKKLEIEVRGRFSVLYWAAGEKNVLVPYLHGFLNCPLLLYLSVPCSLIAAALWTGWALLLPGGLLLVEIALSGSCLRTAIPYRLRDRLYATLYVLLSDLLTPLCGVQYCVSSYYPGHGWFDV